MRKAGAEPVKVASASLDVNEIVGKIKDFVDSIREMSLGEEPMAVSVEGFNFSVGRAAGKYDLSFNVTLAFKPTKSKTVASEPF